MKILMITGASRSVLWFRKELIAYLKQKGHQLFVVSCDNENKNDILSLGVSFYCAGGDNRDTGITSNIKYRKCIKELTEEVKPDTILTFQAKANTFGVLGSTDAGIINIYSMVEGLGSVFNNSGIKYKILKFVMHFLYKKAFKKVKTVFFLNQSNQDYMIKRSIVKENQCYLINGIGVDTSEFKISFERKIDKIKFVMVSRIIKEKGIIEYCEAAKILKAKGINNAEFNLYGNLDEGEQVIKPYIDGAFINYCGYSNDIKSVLQDNNIFVLPSYHEGISRSIMEAMSMGMPIITTDIPGCKETVEDNYNGLLVNIKDSLDLSKKMEYFIKNIDKIAQMGQNSRIICEEKFDCNLINQKISAILEEK